jgi:hypothetical protein
LSCACGKALAARGSPARRGYRFDQSKLDPPHPCPKLRVTEGQIHREWTHLQDKLLRRDPSRRERNASTADIQPHPLMEIVAGDVESWERQTA